MSSTVEELECDPPSGLAEGWTDQPVLVAYVEEEQIQIQKREDISDGGKQKVISSIALSEPPESSPSLGRSRKRTFNKKTTNELAGKSGGTRKKGKQWQASPSAKPTDDKSQPGNKGKPKKANTRLVPSSSKSTEEAPETCTEASDSVETQSWAQVICKNARKRLRRKELEAERLIRFLVNLLSKGLGR